MTLPPALSETAAALAALLRSRGETVSVCESASGGLISTALLAVPGASAYYVGGLVMYTGAVRPLLSGALAPPAGMRGATEAFAAWEASAVRLALGTTWGIGETGAAGPTGNPYGDPPGHAWVAVAGAEAGPRTRRIATGAADRAHNMAAFALAALTLARDVIEGSAPSGTNPPPAPA